jgi:hypothetical protein
MHQQRTQPAQLTGWARHSEQRTTAHYFDQGLAACKPNAPKRLTLAFFLGPTEPDSFHPCAKCLARLQA